MTRFTVRIIAFKSETEIKGHRSGFLFQEKEDEAPLVITAGHGCPPAGSFVESRICVNHRPLCYNAGKFDVFYTDGQIDFAYSRLPIEVIKRDLPPDVCIENLAYKHSFGSPSSGEAYGFAVWNNYEMVDSGDGLLLPQYCCYEVGMELAGEDTWQYFFKTQKDLKEDEYYEGASGAPISDPEGRICSILLGSTEDKKYLRGHKLGEVGRRLNEGANSVQTDIGHWGQAGAARESSLLKVDRHGGRWSGGRQRRISNCQVYGGRRAV